MATMHLRLTRKTLLSSLLWDKEMDLNLAVKGIGDFGMELEKCFSSSLFGGFLGTTKCCVAL